MLSVRWQGCGVGALLVLAMGMATVPSLEAQDDGLQPGDILFTMGSSIVKLDAPGHGRRSQIDVRPAGTANDGIGVALRDLVVDPASKEIFVLDAGESLDDPGQPNNGFKFHGRILQVDMASGDAMVVGGCIDRNAAGSRPASDNCFRDPFGLARLSDGRFVVTNLRAGFNEGEVWLVDAAGRTLVSRGGFLRDPHHVAVGPDDRIYVAEHTGSVGAHVGGAAVVEIHPADFDPANEGANQTLIAAGGSLQEAGGAVEIEDDPVGGGLVVSSIGFGLIRVDPDDPATDGSNQEVIARQTGRMQFLTGVAVDTDGRIAVADFGAFGHRGALFRVDPPGAGARILFASTPKGICCVNGFVEIIP